jgi:muramoyltetrapeptide carboxypeptidase
MIRPPQLLPGDLIQIVAPASHFDRARFDRGVEVLRGLGFRVTWREDLFDQKRFLAGEDTRRADELHEAFENDDVRGVFCARGGYGSGRLIPHLDPSAFREHPKVFVGFSDITLLLNWIHQTTDLVTFHGPMVTGRMSEGLTPADQASLERVTGQAEPAGGVHAPGAEGWVPGDDAGPLVGGSLSMLASAAGTPAQVRARGGVVFLEDVGEKPYRLDRMLTQLRQSGFFDGVRGLILGDFTACDNEADPETGWKDILKELALELGVPTVVGIPAGHGPENRTLPLGARVRVDGDRATVTIEEAAVSTRSAG